MHVSRQPSYIILWLIGIFQPISPDEIFSIIQKDLDDTTNDIDLDDVKNACEKIENRRLIIRVNRTPSLFSLSCSGNQALSEKARRSRDKSRFYLLNHIKHDAIQTSCGAENYGLGDDASSMFNKLGLEGSESKGFASFIPQSQTLWTRYFKQFSSTGENSASHDIALRYLSFSQWQQVLVARGVRQDDPQILKHLKFDIMALSLMLGVSGQLIGSILQNTNKYYGHFIIRKRSGGDRKIDSPRVFLKVIQRFLLDYYLSSLRVHSSVNSFIKNKSVFSNAQTHKGQAFVGTIDIEDFFGSISTDMVKKILKYNDYDESEAFLIARLCTLNGILPQGAPTSPILSNALLYDFDEKMDNLTKEQDLNYSRYADDLTISGGEKEKVSSALHQAKLMLRENFSLKINENKTRIVSFNGRQVVTGLVVNEKIQPPRYKRHQIRAAFHNASMKDQITKNELNKLRGYYGYLSAAPSLRDTQALYQYKKILSNLSKKLTE